MENNTFNTKVDAIFDKLDSRMKVPDKRLVPLSMSTRLDSASNLATWITVPLLTAAGCAVWLGQVSPDQAVGLANMTADMAAVGGIVLGGGATLGALACSVFEKTRLKTARLITDAYLSLTDSQRIASADRNSNTKQNDTVYGSFWTERATLNLRHMASQHPRLAQACQTAVVAHFPEGLTPTHTSRDVHNYKEHLEVSQNHYDLIFKAHNQYAKLVEKKNKDEAAEVAREREQQILDAQPPARDFLTRLGDVRDRLLGIDAEAPTVAKSENGARNPKV